MNETETETGRPYALPSTSPKLSGDSITKARAPGTVSCSAAFLKRTASLCQQAWEAVLPP